MARAKKTAKPSRRDASPSNGFFAVRQATFRKACEQGINAAIAYLILARGSGRNQRYSRWSINAIEKYTSISRARARAAIKLLQSEGIIRNVGTGERPRYDLLPWIDVEPEADTQPPGWVWLPNSLTDGISGETPIIERLRQTQEVLAIRLLVDLYGVHDLIEDGGLPRSLVCRVHQRHRIGQQAQFVVWGFQCEGEALVHGHDLIALYGDPEADDPDACLAGFWDLWEILEDVGAIEWAPHLAEADTATAELFIRLALVAPIP